MGNQSSTGGRLVEAVRSYAPGWVVRAMPLGGQLPAVACRRRHVILVDPRVAAGSESAVCGMLRSLGLP